MVGGQPAAISKGLRETFNFNARTRDLSQGTRPPREEKAQAVVPAGIRLEFSGSAALEGASGSYPTEAPRRGGQQVPGQMDTGK